MIIAVDFDGTCVTHEYPRVGKNIGAGPILRKLVELGHKLILFTMRSNPEGDLKDALEWFDREGIELWGINENPDQDWSDSPKPYAHLYIDDTALGCPLIWNIDELKRFNAKRSFVDWYSVIYSLNECGVFDSLDSKEFKKLLNDVWNEYKQCCTT